MKSLKYMQGKIKLFKLIKHLLGLAAEILYGPFWQNMLYKAARYACRKINFFLAISQIVNCIIKL
jgi:hypothetical protein